MLLKVEKHQKLLMLNLMDDLYIEDEYPRRPRKFYKPTLKGEINTRILGSWINEIKKASAYKTPALFRGTPV